MHTTDGALDRIRTQDITTALAVLSTFIPESTGYSPTDSLPHIMYREGGMEVLRRLKRELTARLNKEP